MFNLKTASSRVKKAAYIAGVREGHWQPHGKDLVIIFRKNGSQFELNPADMNYAEEFTWEDIRSGRYF